MNTNYLDELTLKARKRRRELDALSGEARSVLLRGKEIQSEIGSLSEEITEYERITHLFNSLGEERQIKAQRTIEELVTRGLQTIFDDTLSFHIMQSVKGRSSIVEFLVRTTLPESVVETPVMDARGGGLAATVGFLLRVVVMLLSKGAKQENILVLDESFSHVSDEYLPAVGEFLREIVDRTGIQIILVTHQPMLTEGADKVYRFSQKDGSTVVAESA